MAEYIGRHIVDERIDITGAVIRRCYLDGCVLVFRGGSLVMTDTTIKNCQVEFKEAAAATLVLARYLLENGVPVEGLRAAE